MDVIKINNLFGNTKTQSEQNGRETPTLTLSKFLAFFKRSLSHQHVFRYQ